MQSNTLLSACVFLIIYKRVHRLNTFAPSQKMYDIRFSSLVARVIWRNTLYHQNMFLKESSTELALLMSQLAKGHAPHLWKDLHPYLLSTYLCQDLQSVGRDRLFQRMILQTVSHHLRGEGNDYTILSHDDFLFDRLDRH